MANDFTGRIHKITTTGTVPMANVKYKGGTWTGGTAADVFTIVDEAGRSYSWTYPADGSQVTFQELGWLSGPISITSMPHGEVNLYLGTK